MTVHDLGPRTVKIRFTARLCKALDTTEMRFGVLLFVTAMLLGAVTGFTDVQASNGYYDIKQQDGAITMLRIDASGDGHFGCPLIAPGQAMTGVSSIELHEDRLTLRLATGRFTWPLPFSRKGFYDADRQLHYPSPTDADLVSPQVLPIRKFVTSSGQLLPIEYFKRLPLGQHGLKLNLGRVGRLWLVGDPSVNGHVQVDCDGGTTVRAEIGDDFLSLHCDCPSKTVVFQLCASASIVQQQLPYCHPSLTFRPDIHVTYDFTNKSVPASDLATKLIQTGICWHPGTINGGEWVLDAVRTHLFDDLRMHYCEGLRRGLLKNLSYVGYDRFEHFGMVFNWGAYPDYGAGGLLNVPPGNAPYDMRMLHVNAMQIIAAAEYVMSTGDKSLLSARDARFVATDGQEQQPICGANAHDPQIVLAAGDVRVDGQHSKKTFHLGQSFKTQAPFTTVILRLGVMTTNPADTYAQRKTAKGWVTLHRLNPSQLITRRAISLQVGDPDQSISIQLGEIMEPGRYEVQLSDERSGRHYFGPHITWWTECDSKDSQPPASRGPFSGDLLEQLEMVFDYLRNCTGASDTDLSYYVDDRKFNVLDQKSGRSRISMQNSYHECIGGGFDAFTGLWYPGACRAMAQLHELAGHSKRSRHFRQLEHKSIQAYNRKYWHHVEENGHTFGRYLGCVDWDGKVHDYGFTYYNLEAADLGIATPEQARQILWWLDRGYWKQRPDQPWQSDIYSIWQVAPPFNTIEIGDWIGVTGKLPYREVLSNGGTRLSYAARDLAVRRKYLSIDNMHERCKQVLARFAGPDRLTGGRTAADPGGRGRWHFGPPMIDRADIEGFREIFPGNGSLSTAIIQAYLGAEFFPKGLRLQPQLPSELDQLSLSGIGFRGAVLDIDFQAVRKPVSAQPIDGRQPDHDTYPFRASASFNKVGLSVHLSPNDEPFHGGAHARITLEQQVKGIWQTVATNWLSHLRDRQMIWVRVNRSLEPSVAYRLRVHDCESPYGATLKIRPSKTTERPAVPQLLHETTRLNVRSRYTPDSCHVILQNGDLTRYKITATPTELHLGPGQTAWLTLRRGH